MAHPGKHLDPTVTWGHVLTTLALVGAIIGLWIDNGDRHSNADKRITVVEVQLTAAHDARKEFSQQLKGIDSKLDRLIERQLPVGGK